MDSPMTDFLGEMQTSEEFSNAEWACKENLGAAPTVAGAIFNRRLEAGVVGIREGVPLGASVVASSFPVGRGSAGSGFGMLLARLAIAERGAFAIDLRIFLAGVLKV